MSQKNCQSIMMGRRIFSVTSVRFCLLNFMVTALPQPSLTPSVEFKIRSDFSGHWITSACRTSAVANTLAQRTGTGLPTARRFLRRKCAESHGERQLVFLGASKIVCQSEPRKMRFVMPVPPAPRDSSDGEVCYSSDASIGCQPGAVRMKQRHGAVGSF